MFSLFIKSPLTRAAAALIVEYLISKGLIPAQETSKAVEDAATIIGYIAMFATVLIYQWKTHHHPQVKVDLPEAPAAEVVKTRKSLSEFLKAVLARLFVQPAPQQ